MPVAPRVIWTSFSAGRTSQKVGLSCHLCRTRKGIIQDKLTWEGFFPPTPYYFQPKKKTHKPLSFVYVVVLWHMCVFSLMRSNWISIDERRKEKNPDRPHKAAKITHYPDANRNILTGPRINSHKSIRYGRHALYRPAKFPRGGEKKTKGGDRECMIKYTAFICLGLCD